MASLLQIVTKVSIVIDFPVEHDADRLVLVVDRLAPRLNVYNGEPTHPQGHALAEVKSVAIRTAMRDQFTHPADTFTVVSAYTTLGESDNAAHGRSGVIRRWVRCRSAGRVDPPPAAIAQ